jgi:hypothetical protein
MPGDGPADGNKVARFAVDLPGFLRWLSAAREGPSGFSDPESPKVDKSLMWVCVPSYSQIMWARNCDVLGQSGLCYRVVTANRKITRNVGGYIYE